MAYAIQTEEEEEHPLASAKLHKYSRVYKGFRHVDQIPKDAEAMPIYFETLLKNPSACPAFTIPSELNLPYPEPAPAP